MLDGDRTVYAQPLDDPASVAAAEAAGRHAAARALELIRQEGEMRVRSPIGDLPFTVTGVRRGGAASS